MAEALEWDKKAAARFFHCLRLEVRQKPADEAKVVLQDLLDTAHANSIEQMLEYFFDNFMRLLGTDCFLVLQEKCQDHKFLYRLIHKIQSMCQGDCGEATLASLQCSAQQWHAFAAIIAVLEEQDSSLVVSTLEKQLPQLQLMASDHGKRWLSWLRTLCLRLFQEDRVQVLCKTLEYFLAHLSIEQLVRLSLLSEFLVATNRSQLFDREADNCLRKVHLTRLVSEGNVQLFLEALVTLSWENVPLILWIRSFESKQVQRVPKELLIKLCLVVRAIGNNVLRDRAQVDVIFLFKNTIDAFSLRDYMVCMESLFNKADPYRDHDRLEEKIANCTDLQNHIDLFNRRSYDIFFHNTCRLNNIIEKLYNAFILEREYRHMNGFWRLALCSNNQKVITDFYRKFYNVDISLLQKEASPEKMLAQLMDRVDCQTSEEASFLKARCLDLFISNLDSWDQLEDLNFNPQELLKQGTENIVSTLARFLGSHGYRIMDEEVLPALIARVRYFDEMKNVLDYAYRNLTEKEFERFFTNQIIQKTLVCLPHLPNRKLSISLYLKLLLHGEPTRGLARIEASCAFYSYKDEDRNARIRRLTIENINEYGNTEIKAKVFKELLKINEKLSMEHPHYTENSEVHRQKMRIAYALIRMCHHSYDPVSSMGLLLPGNHCDDPLPLKTLLLPSDHLGINLMHEYLIGCSLKNIDSLLKSLPSYEPRQLESVLSIAHIFIIRNLRNIKKDKLSEMFTSLQPLTMGSCYEVRTLAQIILHRLALECELNSIHIPVAESLINLVEASLGKRLYELQSEPRLVLAEIPLYFRDHNSEVILDITSAPFDELHNPYGRIPQFVWNNIRNAREAFRARKLRSAGQFTASNKLSMKVPPNDDDFKVVASLLDEKTNFARLMVSCKRFSVDTLILDEESQLEEYDSCNLRIRRVKPASLVEFLLTKRTEGYEIHGCMGIEGISKVFRMSVADRVILVLGHKELGIPANVNEILENPVRIPKKNLFTRLFDKKL
ncbi:uncharacterized protein [Drosophila kikkawai]|uniref:Uncharacterized protein isoform X1 n=2 Tax=Drosophila kikkawai TaxID=30033 RepID=A0A6P4IDG0_DROKI